MRHLQHGYSTVLWSGVYHAESDEDVNDDDDAEDADHM